MLESQVPTDLPPPPNSCICHVCYYYVQNAFTQQSLWVQWHLRLFLSENCGCSSLEIVTAHGTKWNLILLNLEERKTYKPQMCHIQLLMFDHVYFWCGLGITV